MNSEIVERLEGIPHAKILRLIAIEGGAGKEAFLKQLYDDLHGIIRDLESTAQHLDKQREESITSQIKNSLRSCGYDASSDPDHRGHVDLAVEMRPLYLSWHGEAKFLKGNAYVEEGLIQLLCRYESGREAYGGMLLYAKKKHALTAVSNWRSHIERKKLLGLVGVPTCLDDRHQFTSTHKQATDIAIQVTHFPLFLQYAPEDKSARQSKRKKKAKKTPD